MTHWANLGSFPAVPTHKQGESSGHEAKQLPGTYRQPLERLDMLHHGRREGETGALMRRLQSCVDRQGYLCRAPRALVQTYAEARVVYRCRARGPQEAE